MVLITGWDMVKLVGAYLAVSNFVFTFTNQVKKQDCHFSKLVLFSTVAFVCNGFSYNVNSAVMSHFPPSRQKFFPALKFAFKSIAHDVNSPIKATLFVSQTYLFVHNGSFILNLCHMLSLSFNPVKTRA